VCVGPAGALTRALQDQELATGASTVGARPIRADRRIFAGEDLVISVYCPHKLSAYRSYIDANRYDGVIRGWAGGHLTNRRLSRRECGDLSLRSGAGVSALLDEGSRGCRLVLSPNR